MPSLARPHFLAATLSHVVLGHARLNGACVRLLDISTQIANRLRVGIPGRDTVQLRNRRPEGPARNCVVTLVCLILSVR
jgi:hypothetical protein